MSRMFAADTGSTASNGSSSTSSRGACTSAHARATFFVMPAEYSTTSFVGVGGQVQGGQQVGRAGGDGLAVEPLQQPRVGDELLRPSAGRRGGRRRAARRACP